jgi:hypothetical protein
VRGGRAGRLWGLAVGMAEHELSFANTRDHVANFNPPFQEQGESQHRIDQRHYFDKTRVEREANGFFAIPVYTRFGGFDTYFIGTVKSSLKAFCRKCA